LPTCSTPNRAKVFAESLNDETFLFVVHFSEYRTVVLPL